MCSAAAEAAEAQGQQRFKPYRFTSPLHPLSLKVRTTSLDASLHSDVSMLCFPFYHFWSSSWLMCTLLLCSPAVRALCSVRRHGAAGALSNTPQFFRILLTLTYTLCLATLSLLTFNSWFGCANLNSLRPHPYFNLTLRIHPCSMPSGRRTPTRACYAFWTACTRTWRSPMRRVRSQALPLNSTC